MTGADELTLHHLGGIFATTATIKMKNEVNENFMKGLTTKTKFLNCFYFSVTFIVIYQSERFLRTLVDKND